MASQQVQDVVGRSEALRIELKAWERAFAKANGGQRPGRDDIKKDAAIASKYKEYTNLRNGTSAKAAQHRESSPSESPSKKRKLSHEKPSTVARMAKPRRPYDTPSKSVHPAVLDPYDSPSIVRKLQFTPSRQAAVGPTPQRDGKVLGLFDLLDEEQDSPMKTRTNSRALADITPNKLRTPRKPVQEDVVTPLRHSRTPMSSGRRFLLNTFVTPAKRKPAEEDLEATPAFLRRGGHWLKTQRYNENGEPEFDSPVAVRLPVKPHGKGLSTLIADLRKLENERLDDELDVLRELENEQSGGKSQPKLATAQPVGDQVRSQTQDENGTGLVSEVTPAETDQGALGEDGKPMKPRKKKGQKRTTKRVIIRPSRAKPKPQPEAIPPTSETGDDMDKPFQLTSLTIDHDHDNSSDPLVDHHCPSQARDSQINTSYARSLPTSSDTKTGQAKKEPKAKKTKKAKINPHAHSHTNFRKLKIKNQNTRAKRAGAGGRRFGNGGGRRR